MADNNPSNAAEGTVEAATAVETENPAALTTEALNEHALDTHPLDAIQSADAAAANTDSAASDRTDTDGAGSDGASSNGFEAPSSTRAAYNDASQPELNDSLSSGSGDDEPRRDVPGGRSYEITFITRANDADATESATNRLRSLVEGGAGAIDNVRTSEVRRLAYTIGGQIEGVYTVVNARFTTEHIPEIDRFFKLEEAVLRHMILKEEL